MSTPNPDYSVTNEADKLAAWLASTLDEIERVARKATKEGLPERWHWVYSVSDEPVDLDTVSDLEFIGADNDCFRVSFRSIEEYSEPEPLPHRVLYEVEEVTPAVARHIALYDPAAVLARVEADQRIVRECVEWIEIGQVRPGTTWNDDAAGAECAQEVLRLLAWGMRHHPGYRAEWAPEVRE